MLKIFVSCFFCFLFSLAHAQEPFLKAGDKFPDLIIRPIINAPVKQFDIATENKKILILNFWGTWCVPCLPEMDSLAVLQEKNKTNIQVIAISSETTDRLQKYLQRKPSKLWLASDTGFYLYQQFAFNYVGQCAVIDRHNRIIAVTRTDSINQRFIDKVLRNEPFLSYAEVGNKRDVTEKDLFDLDSSLAYYVSISSFRPALGSMGKKYPKTVFENRRRSYINSCAEAMYLDAFDKHGYGAFTYEASATKEACNFNDKKMLWCFDILVSPEQKDSFNLIMQRTLNKLLPLKARIEKKVVPVYVLKQKPGSDSLWRISDAPEMSHWFSGKGFEGKAVPVKLYTNYLSNDLDLPVVDETGLTGKYDIKTENVMRTKEEVIKAAERLGLVLEKANREIDILIFYK